MKKIVKINDITGETESEILLADDIPESIKDKNHTHYQSTASTVWVVNHGLGKYPSFTVTGIYGNEIIPGKKNIDINTTEFYFNYPTIGYVHFN